jgi:hypothetical protein
MQTQRRLQITSLLLVVFLALTLTTRAQTFRGGINGTVVDATGAAVAGASVVATDTATGIKTTGVSTSSGEFLFQDLPLGEYSIAVTAKGFANTKVEHVNVSAGAIYTLPVKLAVSSSSETIEVSASSVALDTTTPRPSPTCRSTAATSPR